MSYPYRGDHRAAGCWRCSSSQTSEPISVVVGRVEENVVELGAVEGLCELDLRLHIALDDLDLVVALGHIHGELGDDGDGLSLVCVNHLDCEGSSYRLVLLETDLVDSVSGDGLDVLDAIASVKTGNYGWYMQDVPREPVVIETIEVVE